MAASLALERALDDAPLRPVHWKIWFLSAMGIFLDGFDLFIISVALPLIKRQYAPDDWTLGLIGAAAPLGAMLGAFILGPFTDRFGRKAMYLIDLLIFAVFSVLSALAWDSWSLIAFRLLLGVGVGADYPISASYIAEFMPARLRGKMLIGAFSFQAAGSVGGALVGLALLSFYPHEMVWRWMLAAGVLPALFLLVLRARVPESPRWYLCQGDYHGAAASARVILGERYQVARLETDLGPVPALITAPPALPFRTLFGHAYLRRTLLGCIPWFLMDVGLYGVGIFTPVILTSVFAGPSSTRGSTASFIAADIVATEQAVFLDLFLVVGFLLSLVLLERLGRIRLQMLGFLGMTVGLALLALAAFQAGGARAHLVTVFVGFGLFNLMVNCGPNPTTYLLPAELFPTQLRASGHGLAAAAGKVGAVVGLFLLPVLLDRTGLGWTMTLVSAACFLGFLVTRLLAVETTGKSLEELAL